MDKDRIMEALNENYPDHPNLWMDKMLNDQDWEALNCPYIWQVEQEANDHILLSDIGYGKLVLYANGEIVSSGSDTVYSEDMTIVGLSEYYGLERPTLYRQIPKEGDLT